MKKNIYLGLLSIFMFCTLTLKSQTTGTLNFSTTITEPTGGYNNKLVIAIWLEDSATGNFIKTKLRYAVTEVQYLNVWIAKSGQNVVDAVTGATTSPGNFSIVWNGTDVSGTVVPDGNYKVWIQFSDKNASGPTKYCTFVKGPNAINNLTFPNSGNFTNMVLNWTPGTTNTQSISKNTALSVFPNPTQGLTNIFVNLNNDGPLSISVYDFKGQLVKQIAKNVLADASTNCFTWDCSINNNEKAPKGVYFIKVSSPEFEKILKVMVL